MKPVLALAAIAVLLGAPAVTVLAQGTDFSGTWNLDRDNSELPRARGGGRSGGGGGRQGGGGRGGGRGRGGFGARPAETLVISQTAATVAVEQHSGDESASVDYALDGDETTVEVANGTLTVTASLDGEALVTVGTQSIETGRGNFTLDITER